MLCLAVMVIFGLIALVKGEFKITSGRKVSGTTGRVLGVLLLIGAGSGLLFGEFGSLVQIGAFVLVIVIGLATSEKIEKEVQEKGPSSESEI